jgi:5-(aminomethyl)-3-furanmethanol phosphate kinase
MRGLIGLTVVVKLGGSYAFSTHLRDWIDAIALCAGRVVVAPGGGPFADAVREVQRKMGLDDRAAHHMALLAMDQYGCALASLGRRLTPAASASAIRRVLLDGGVPVWSATRMVLGAKDIPWSWDVTSDSLAAWLAGRIGAKRVLLVKHVEPSADLLRAEDLVARGIIDPAFPRFLGASGAEAFIAGTTEHGAAAVAMRNGGMVGARIDLS